MIPGQAQQDVGSAELQQESVHQHGKRDGKVAH